MFVDGREDAWSKVWACFELRVGDPVPFNWYLNFNKIGGRWDANASAWWLSKANFSCSVSPTQVESFSSNVKCMLLMMMSAQIESKPAIFHFSVRPQMQCLHKSRLAISMHQDWNLCKFHIGTINKKILRLMLNIMVSFLLFQVEVCKIYKRQDETCIDKDCWRIKALKK